jgi:hypothetical protein
MSIYGMRVDVSVNNNGLRAYRVEHLNYCPPHFFNDFRLLTILAWWAHKLTSYPQSAFNNFPLQVATIGPDQSGQRSTACASTPRS